MTEAEEKAIEYLKDYIKSDLNYFTIDFNDNLRIAINLIEKLQKENSELQEKIENLKMNIAINYTESSKLRHIVMSLPNGLEILEKL